MQVIFMTIKSRLFLGSLKRVLIIFLCTSLIMTLVLMFVSSSLYQNILRSNTAQSISFYASEQKKMISDELANIRTALYSLAQKEEITDYLDGNQGYRAANSRYIAALLGDLPTYVPYISDIVLLFGGQRITAMSYNKSDMHNFLIRQQIVQKIAQGKQSGTLYFSIPAEHGENFLLAIAVPTPVTHKEDCYALAFSTVNALFRNLSFVQTPFAVFANGECLYANADSEEQLNEMRLFLNKNEENDGGKWLSFTVPGPEWRVVLQSPLQEEKSIFTPEMLRWSVILLVIFILIQCILILAIHKAIIAPISSISTQSTKINSSATLIDNPAPGRNELNTLVNNINAMVARTNQMALEISQAKLSLMEKDILHLKERNMFLQAQINPHFLYNMLECICGMAAQEGNAAIREVTLQMATLYRYCLKSPESTLGEELECLECYQKILALRYKEGYRMDVDVPEDLYLLPLPRMVLEPLVENAVQHGFVRGSNQEFFVRITAELRENELHLAVIDNGCGMPEELMTQLNERLRGDPFANTAKGERIGLHNVGMRLRLVYESPSGLYLEKNEMGGLTARMLIIYSLPDLEETE